MLTQKIGRLLFSLGVWVIAFNASLGGAQDSASLKKAPLNPDFVSCFSEVNTMKVAVKDSQAPRTGYIPGPVSLKHLTSITPKLLPKSKNEQLPNRYDLRSKNKLTPIKDQLTTNACWAFATFASMESSLLPGETWDFSENNLKNTHGFDWGWNGGGNAGISTAYLARWSGPIAESADRFNEASGISPEGLKPVKHVQNVTFVPLRTSANDNDAIKTAIMKYGAFYVSYYHDDKYYKKSTAAYYYNGTENANHAVAIVGWDDNYSKSNFVNPPEGNGAFIFKNSWGTNYGENGYYYVSYYDTQFGRSENAQFSAPESTQNYSQIYQYDPLGLTGTWGFESDTAWMANIFTATRTASLKAVSFYTLSTSNTYTVKIYTGVGALPTSGTLVATQTGQINQSGYNTILLKTSVALLANQKFSVVVQLTSTGYQYPIGIEDPVTNYSSKAQASKGQSFISSNGTSWTDLTSEDPNGNVCLKAFTK